MKKLKTITLALSLGILNIAFPYINIHALPIVNLEGEQAIISTLNEENKIIIRNQKEKMVEILVSMYNKYNSILKQGLELNDIENYELYYNITSQKYKIKNLLDDIINYPYSIVSDDIENKFLNYNIIFCELNNKYISKEIFNMLHTQDISDIKNTLKNIIDTFYLSIHSLKFPDGIYKIENLNNHIEILKTSVNTIYNMNSFNSKKYYIYNNINNLCINIADLLREYKNI